MQDYSLIPQHEAVEKSRNRLRDNIKRPWGLFGIDTGHHPLNMLIGGWIPGKLTTIAGRSGHGKSALVSQFPAGGVIVNGRRAHYLFMTWEMESSYLVDRYICNQVGVTHRMLTQGAKLIGPKTRQEIGRVLEEAKKLPVLYQEISINIEKARAIIEEFVNTCEKLSKAEGAQVQPVVVIDYIQMGQFEGTGPRTYGIGDYVNGLKRIANTTGASICVFAQIGRKADSKPLPERNDLADSQSIEMASDNLIMIYRPEYVFEKTMKHPDTGADIDVDGKLLLRVFKARDYGLGDKMINCDIKYYRFWGEDQPTWDYPYQQWYEKESFWRRFFGFDKIDEEGQMEIV